MCEGDGGDMQDCDDRARDLGFGVGLGVVWLECGRGCARVWARWE